MKKKGDYHLTPKKSGLPFALWKSIEEEVHLWPPSAVNEKDSRLPESTPLKGLSPKVVRGRRGKNVFYFSTSSSKKAEKGDGDLKWTLKNLKICLVHDNFKKYFEATTSTSIIFSNMHKSQSCPQAKDEVSRDTQLSFNWKDVLLIFWAIISENIKCQGCPAPPHWLLLLPSSSSSWKYGSCRSHVTKNWLHWKTNRVKGSKSLRGIGSELIYSLKFHVLPGVPNHGECPVQWQTVHLRSWGGSMEMLLW